MSGMQLSVIIVNFNVKFFLEQCLFSVIKACRDLDAEILVVDNNSTDGSRDYLPSRFPGVRFFWQGENTGFGRANNFALAHASGDYVLFLNPDTIVPEDCFTRCINFFQTTPDCGALGVRMIDGSGRYLKESKRGFPSARASFFKMTGLAALFPSSNIFAAYYNGHLPEKKLNPVDVLAGAFMMLSREMVQVTRGFDEDFFMYAEDIDLSYRIQQAGKKNYYFAPVTIIHFKGESTQKLSSNYIGHFYGAMLLFVRKHYQQRKMIFYVTSTAIHVSKIAAQLKMHLQRTFSPKPGMIPALKVVLVCNEAMFKENINLLKYSTVSYTLLGRVSVNEADSGNSIGTITNLHKLIGPAAINTAIFCEGLLTYQQIIRILEDLPRNLLAMFHAEGSKSMIGSGSKSGNGLTIHCKPEVGLQS